MLFFIRNDVDQYNKQLEPQKQGGAYPEIETSFAGELEHIAR